MLDSDRCLQNATECDHISITSLMLGDRQSFAAMAAEWRARALSARTRERRAAPPVGTN